MPCRMSRESATGVGFPQFLFLQTPFVIDGREVYLCWELGEDEVDFWHDLESGYRGREPLD